MAVVGHPNVLDVGFVDIAQRIGRLDVVVEELVAEVGQRRVVDLGEVVVGNDRIGPQGGVEDEVVDLSGVGRRGVERGARLGQHALGHVDRDPLADFVPAGVDFVLVRRERIDAVVVDADFELHVALGDTIDVISVGPNVEPRGHFLQEVVVVDVRLVVEPTESVGAGVVGEALGLEDRGRGFVLRDAGRRHEVLQSVDRVPRGQSRLDLVVVAEAAVVIEAGVEALQVNVPGEFDVVGAGPRAIPIIRRGDFPRLDIAAFLAQDLLGGFQPVGPGHEWSVAEKFEREARCFHVDLRAGVRRLAAVGHGRHGRLDPLEEVRGSVTHLGKNPRTVLDVRVVGHTAFGRVDEVLRRGRLVTAIGRFSEELRCGFEPRAGAAAPRVVAVGRGNDDDRHTGVRGDMVGDLADAFIGVTVAVGEDVVRGHGIHFLFLAGLGIDIFDPVQPVGEGRDVPRGIAGVGFAEPPLAGIVETVGDLVGAIGRAGLDVEVAFGIRLVVVARAGAADVMAGHQRPLQTLIDQHINEMTRVAHLRWEKALRMVGEIRISAPGFPPCLLEGLDFFTKNRLRQQRTERVVVSETEHVHAGRAGRRLPSARLAETRVPITPVTEVAAAAELADVVDQRARITYAEAAATIDGGQRIARTSLVGAFAVVETENVGEIVLRMLLRTDPAVILRGLHHDGVPRVLPALGLRTIAIPLRPIKRLVIVPEPGNVNVAVVGKS